MPTMRRALLALGLLVSAFAPAARATEQGYLGWTLEAALLDLRERGLALVWSTDTVPPDIKVARAVDAATPEQALFELLAPHGLEVRDEDGTWIVVRRPRPPPPEAVVAAPTVDDGTFRLEPVQVDISRYRLLGQNGHPDSEFLNRAQVERRPHLANDPFRAVATLPGFAASDLSARLNVRGGRHDETLVVLDGMTLYQPFHLRNTLNAFSIVETRSLAGIEVFTGGFATRYGDSLSGVVNMNSMPAHDATRSSIGFTLTNTHMLAAGGDDQAGWLVSGRRGNLDLLGRLVQSDTVVKPAYYDLYAKASHATGEASRLSFHLLYAYDDERYEQPSQDRWQRGAYDNVHAWSTFTTDWTPWLRTATMLYGGGVETERMGVEDGSVQYVAVDDRRDLDFRGLRQTLAIATDGGLTFDAGLERRDVRARYDYRGEADHEDHPPVERDIHLRPEGRALSAWVGGSVEWGDLTFAFGRRWDRQTWHEPDIDHQTSPRAALGWTVSDSLTLRAAWGRYAQAQGVHELQVEDGVTEFAPAERAEHRVLGIYQSFADDVELRIEGYDKRYRDPRPRFENALDSLVLFPEFATDRLLIAPESARARGVEVTLRRMGQPRFDWWFSYTRAHAEDRLDGRDVPRAWDQVETSNLGFDWRPLRGWSVTLTGNYHSGWPTTGGEIELVPLPDGGEFPVVVPGPYNAERFGSTASLNLRTTAQVELDRSQLRFYLEAYNLLNRENPCCRNRLSVEQTGPDEYRVRSKPGNGFPLVPSFGVLWEF